MKFRLESTWARRGRLAVVGVALLLTTAGCLQAQEETNQPEECQPGDACYILPNDTGEADQTDDRAPNRSQNGTQKSSEAIPTLVRHPIDWEGTTGTEAGACVAAGPYPCASSPDVSEADTLLEIDKQINWTTLSVTTHWNATTPLTEEMTLTVTAVVPCGQGCSEYIRVGNVTGPAPLLVQDTLHRIPANATVLVGVGVPARTTPAAFAWAYTDQPFHVVGSLRGVVVGR